MHYDLAFHFSTIQTDSETSGPSLHTALVDDICTGRVQGVLTVGLPAQTLEWINRQGTAVVAFAGEGPVSVNLDGADVVKMGVQTLAARGCRRLALWYPPPTDASEENGNEAEWFRAVLATHGLVFNKHWLRPQEHEPIGNLTFDQVREWVSITFGPAPKTWPDGLLITNDILTRDVMPVLHKRNLLPNHDIVIVSHANSDSPVLRAYEEELTLLEYDSGEIVQTMFDLMETLMRNEAISQRRIIIKPKVRFPRLSSNLQAMHQVTNANKPSR
jgi:DNA-binding LacI/PurR family transcriptional regulator